MGMSETSLYKYNPRFDKKEFSKKNPKLIPSNDINISVKESNDKISLMTV